MSTHAAVTLNRPQDEVRGLWNDPEYRPRYVMDLGPTISFVDAPGDRGTEIHVELSGSGDAASKLPSPFQKLVSAPTLAKVKDELRRFKARVETGEIPRSDSTPEGESAERKLKQRPAQPLPESELAKAGA
jgi:uncharacterized membrane protein